jgi:hypothetical protein
MQANPGSETCPPSPVLIRAWTRINEVLSWRGAMIKNLAVDQIKICITKFKFPPLIKEDFDEEGNEIMTSQASALMILNNCQS